MPVITSIKPQKRKNRVNIYLDGKFSFGLDLENFVKLHLKVEQELSEEEVQKIVKRAEFQKTLDKLLGFATLRPRSEKEIKGWFKRKKVNESLYKDLFDRLKHFELINDEKFARWWIDQRMEFRKKSKRMLTQELRLKGIDRKVIEEALLATDINEKSIAKELLKKKCYRWEKLPLLDRKKKMAEYLLRAGFSWSDTSSAIDDLLGKKV